MPIRAVCFDLDDTLIDSSAAERAGLIEFRARFAAALPDDAALRARWSAALVSAWDRYLRGEISFHDTRRARMRSVFADDAMSDDACDERFAIYLAAYELHWRAFEDVVPALDALAGLPLAIISNARQDQQVAKLRATGIRERFVEVLTPDVVGAGKPQAAIFREACARLGVAPGECLHVGDHLEHDAIAARSAGLQSVWLDRPGMGRAPAALARIGSLAELPALLAGR